jgi:hypothetical protein
MGSTTIPGGGTTDHHGFHVYGGGPDMSHHGGPIGAGFLGHGPRSLSNGGWGTNHGHVGSSNSGPTGGHGFKGHGSGHAQGERFGGHNQSGFGHDTISMGSGHDTLVDAGRAAGTHFGYHVSTHSATMAGGAHHASFIGGHSLMAHGGAGSVAGGTSHVTALFADHKVSTDVIKTFVTGHDKLHLEGQALSYLHSHVDVTVSHGATTLKLDGGHTTIALKGFSHIDTMGHK